MMLSMVMGLVLAWLPMNLINLYRDFDNSEKSSPWFSLIFAFCHVSAMTSAVWNPIIYSWFNPQFKETLLRSIQDKRIANTIGERRVNSICRISRGLSISEKRGIKCALLRKNEEGVTNNLNNLMDTTQLVPNINENCLRLISRFGSD